MSGNAETESARCRSTILSSSASSAMAFSASFRSQRKGSGTESSGGTTKTIVGLILPFRSLTVCVERGTPSRVYLTDQMGCVRLVPE